MKIRFVVSFGMPERTYAGGEEVDLPSKEAKDLVEAGFAEPVGKAPAKRSEKRDK